MAYLDKNRIARSPATLIAVAALEAAAIYAVITGLMVTIRSPSDTRLIARTFPLPKPSPLPSPTVRPHVPLVVDKQPVQLTPPFNTDLFNLGQTSIDPGPVDPPPSDAVEIFPKPSPSPSLGFTARIARPRNSPSGWATAEDYPGSDLRQGNQGLVRFSLTVGADGKVSACIVTASSGFAGLDAATCDKVSRRARFEPATDGSGARVTGAYAGAVRWVIPE